MKHMELAGVVDSVSKSCDQSPSISSEIAIGQRATETNLNPYLHFQQNMGLIQQDTIES